MKTKNIGENKLKNLIYKDHDESQLDNCLLGNEDNGRIEQINTATYIGEYLIRKLKNLHSKKSVSINECEICSRS